MPLTTIVRSPTVPPSWTTVKRVAPSPPFQRSTTVMSTVVRMRSWSSSQAEVTAVTSTTAMWSARLTIPWRSRATTIEADAGEATAPSQPAIRAAAASKRGNFIPP